MFSISRLSFSIRVWDDAELRKKNGCNHFSITIMNIWYNRKCDVMSCQFPVTIKNKIFPCCRYTVEPIWRNDNKHYSLRILIVFAIIFLTITKMPMMLFIFLGKLPKFTYSFRTRRFGAENRRKYSWSQSEGENDRLLKVDLQMFSGFRDV